MTLNPDTKTNALPEAGSMQATDFEQDLSLTMPAADYSGKLEVGEGSLEAKIATITLAVQTRLREGSAAQCEWRKMIYEQAVQEEILPENVEVADILAGKTDGLPEDFDTYGSALELASIFERELGLSVQHGCCDDYLTLPGSESIEIAHLEDIENYSKLSAAMRMAVGLALESEAYQLGAEEELVLIIDKILEAQTEMISSRLDVLQPFEEHKRMQLAAKMANDFWPVFDPDAAEEPSLDHIPINPVIGEFSSADIAAAIRRWL